MTDNINVFDLVYLIHMRVMVITHQSMKPDLLPNFR